MDTRKRGQSLVEFALILPILIAVFLAIIDGAFIMQGYLATNHAAREAARFAVTYQPVQGTCLAHDIDGDGIEEQTPPYPWCPYSAEETDDQYFDRRVLIIKTIAREAAIGLRVDTYCDNSGCIEAHNETPGMYGVRVWGFQSFESSETEDRPGIPGLPVRVQVVHNVPLVVFAPVFPNAFIRVDGATEMINEGVQVGYGNVAPPTFQPLPTSIPPTGGPPTITPPPPPTVGPAPTATPAPDLKIALNFETALNILPDDREHFVAARVTDPSGQPIAGAQVTFRTDEGSFSYSGAGTQAQYINTTADGWARTAIYANEPLVANIDAWLDYNVNGSIDGGEPSDSAVKTWEITPDTPYLIVSNHYPAPLDWIAVDVMDHAPSENPYSLWLCPITGTAIIHQLASPVNVDGVSEDLLDIPVEIPIGVAGTYRIESHRGGGGANGCTEAGTLAAYSAPVLIKEVPPDLIISDVTIVNPEEERLTGKPLTVTVEIANTGPVSVTGGPFDVDIYLNLEDPPSVRQLGKQKQWVEALGPQASTVITFVLLPDTFGDNNLWAQVDTTNYINEGDTGGEDNNVFGPLNFVVECGVFDETRSDDFDGGLRSIWTGYDVGSGVNGSTTVNGGGELEVRSRGTTLWSGDNSFYYIYQAYNGDFDARLRVIEEPTTNQWAKIGLHIRESVNRNAPYISALMTHRYSPAAEQMAYRDSPGGNANRIPGSNNNRTDLPVWVRVVRKDNTYDYYYAYGDDPEVGDWVRVGSHTASRELGLIGIAQASYNSGSYANGTVDDFRICTAEGNALGGPTINPPGLVECTELLNVRGFEGNPETVYQFWRAGEEAAAFARTSEQFFLGSFSMKLNATLYAYPCDEPGSNMHPFVYQEVNIPTDIYSHTTLTVDGRYFVDGSNTPCSYGIPDADDQLNLQLQLADGSSIMAAQVVTTGAAISQTWQTRMITLSDHINLQDYAGERMRMFWRGTHDGDYYGTAFYMDEVTAQLCSVWPVPEDEPGTASVGGLVSTIGEFNVPMVLPGADVLAYAQGGEIYQTRAIHDGTYHFYNIPPGDYVVYAEAWINNALRTATTYVTLSADERNYGVNLLVQ